MLCPPSPAPPSQQYSTDLPRAVKSQKVKINLTGNRVFDEVMNAVPSWSWLPFRNCWHHLSRNIRQGPPITLCLSRDLFIAC